jgi:anti-sigma28 factor (negative regulator of flagellin synthesis)
MKVYGTLFDPLRPDRSVAPPQSPARPADGGVGGVEPAPEASPVRRDSVQISATGRSLAGRIEAEDRVALDPERVAELRRKVYEGAYNTLDVVDQVARRILSRGDL